MSDLWIVETSCLAAGFSDEQVALVLSKAKRLLEIESERVARIVSPEVAHMVERLNDVYDFDAPCTRKLSAMEVCKELGFENPTIGECTHCGMALVKVSKRKPVRTSRGRVHLMPNQRF